MSTSWPPPSPARRAARPTRVAPAREPVIRRGSAPTLAQRVAAAAVTALVGFALGFGFATALIGAARIGAWMLTVAS